jgi:hypothetical protein
MLIYSNQQASSILLSSVSSKLSHNQLEWAFDEAIVSLTPQEWTDFFKKYDEISKLTASTPNEEVPRVMPTDEYAQVGYMRSLASKNAFDLDMEAEKEGRSRILEEPVSYDPVSDTFTTAQAWSDMSNRANKIFSHIQEAQASRLEAALEHWQRAQVWSAAGSASKFRAPKIPGDPSQSGYSKPMPEGSDVRTNSMNGLVHEVGREWSRLAAMRAKDPVSYENLIGGVRDPKVREYVREHTRHLRGLTEKEGQMNKRSALEILLWEAVVATVQGTPHGIAVAAIKYEDGKTRLLLTLETLHYIIYSFVLSVFESAVSADDAIDHIASKGVQYGQYAAKVRRSRARKWLRLWDYIDFNSQHSNLGLVIDNLFMSTLFDKIGRDTGASTTDYAQYSEWIAYSFNNTMIEWGEGNVELSESGLSSGTKGTTFVNVTKNPQYNFVPAISMLRLYGRFPVEAEQDKGDDVYQEVLSWVEATLLNRLSRACGWKGQDSKVIVGQGFAEYTRNLYDMMGNVSGCVNRSIAVMVVGSFQNAPYRDGPEMLASHSALCDLLVRRHANAKFVAVLQEIWADYWGRVSASLPSHTTASGRSASVPPPTRGHKMPSAAELSQLSVGMPDDAPTRMFVDLDKSWVASGRLLNGADVSRAPKGSAVWSCCTATGNPKIDKQLTCPCGGLYCWVTPHLCAYPMRPQHFSPSTTLLRQLGGVMTHNYKMHVVRVSRHAEQLSHKQWERLSRATMTENMMNVLPGHERARLQALDDAADVIWAYGLKAMTDKNIALVHSHPYRKCEWRSQADYATRVMEALRLFAARLKNVPHLPKLVRQLGLMDEESFGQLDTRLHGFYGMPGKKQALMIADRLFGEHDPFKFEQGCPVCMKRTTAMASVYHCTRITNTIWPHLAREVDEYIIKPLSPDYAGSLAVGSDEWEHSLGAGAATRLGRRDTLQLLLNADHHISCSPSPPQGSERSSEWLVFRLAEVARGLISHRKLDQLLLVMNCMTHAAASDWLWGDVLVSRRDYFAVGNLSAIAISGAVFTLVQQYLPGFVNDNPELGFVQRQTLQQVVSTLTRLAISVCQRHEAFNRIQGD